MEKVKSKLSMFFAVIENANDDGDDFDSDDDSDSESNNQFTQKNQYPNVKNEQTALLIAKLRPGASSSPTENHNLLSPGHGLLVHRRKSSIAMTR